MSDTSDLDTWTDDMSDSSTPVVSTNHGQRIPFCNCGQFQDVIIPLWKVSKSFYVRAHSVLLLLFCLVLFCFVQLTPVSHTGRIRV